jgi:hypothetical protein
LGLGWDQKKVFTEYRNTKSGFRLIFLRYGIFNTVSPRPDLLCGLVVRVLGYRSGGLGLIPGTNEELLDRKVAAPV